MHWCPLESEAVLIAGGAAGGVVLSAPWYWQRLKRWVGYRLLARHLHRCGATCDCRRYTKLVPMAA